MPGISEPRPQDLGSGKGGGKGEGGGSWVRDPARLTLASLPSLGHLRAKASGFRGRGEAFETPHPTLASLPSLGHLRAKASI